MANVMKLCGKNIPWLEMKEGYMGVPNIIFKFSLRLTFSK